MATELDTPAHEPPPGSSPGSASPSWLAEVVEVLELRRSALVATALGLSLLGVLTALVVPQLLPPRPLVGAAVGLAAILLAVAVALGVDSVDLTIRGPRHIRASGGRLAAEVAGPPDVRTVATAAAAVSRRVGGGRGLVGITVASEHGADPRAWTEVLARALSGRDLRVLLVDLTTPRAETPGVAEVAAGERRLAEAVDFDHELMLASIGPGRDRRESLAGLATLVGRLPSDIEVLLVALPHLSEPGALAAAGALDRVLVLVEEGRTARVDLIAALDAVDATSASSEVLLLTEDEPVPAPPADETGPERPTSSPVTLPVHDGEGHDTPRAPRPPLARMEPAPEPRPLAEDAVEAPVEDAVEDAGGEPSAEPVVGLTAVEDASLADEDWGDGVTEAAAAAAAAGLIEQRDDAPSPEAPDADDLPDRPAGPAATTPVATPVVATPAEDFAAAPDPVEADDEGSADDVWHASAPHEDPDPTLETPPVVVHDDVIPGPGDDEHRDPERWAAPARHDELVGSHLPAGPFPDQQDLPEDPVRVAAALQTLAAEVWSRDEDPS